MNWKQVKDVAQAYSASATNVQVVLTPPGGGTASGAVKVAIHAARGGCRVIGTSAGTIRLRFSYTPPGGAATTIDVFGPWQGTGSAPNEVQWTPTEPMIFPVGSAVTVNVATMTNAGTLTASSDIGVTVVYSFTS